MTRAALAALFLAAPLAFAGPGGPPPQLAPCMPVNLSQMSWAVKSEESLRVVPVYMPINIFKARAELKPKAAAPAKAAKKKKRIQVCKRFSKKKKRCTWLAWVTK